LPAITRLGRITLQGVQGLPLGTGSGLATPIQQIANGAA
jgi:hypothetical protein